MISSQMDNPFAIGDLVHIPQGVVLYDPISSNKPQKPMKINDRPIVGLVMSKLLHHYTIMIGEEEYLISKEDITLVSRKAMR